MAHAPLEDPPLRWPIVTAALVLTLGAAQFLWPAVGLGADELAGGPGAPWQAVYRSLSSALIHQAWSNLLLNATWIALSGWYVERWLGGGRVLLIFVLGVVVGQAVAGGGLGASAGASALTGAALVIAAFRARRAPRMTAVAAVVAVIAPVTFEIFSLFRFSAFLGDRSILLGGASISHAAHGAGYVIGAATALAFRRVWRRAWIVAGATVGLAVAVNVLLAYALAPRIATDEAVERCAAGDEVTCRRVLPLLEESCAREDERACFAAGSLADHGHGGASRDAARGFFDRSCTLGSAEGCYNLGISMANGEGGPVDLEGARQPLAVACEKGLLPACRARGVIAGQLRTQARRLTAQELEREAVAERAYLGRACDGGFASACAIYALVLVEGRGGPQDTARAAAAAARGCRVDDAQACATLSLLETTPAADRERARAVLDRLCARADAEACSLRDQLNQSGGRP